MVKMLNRYGKFSKDKREFIITRPDTPAPWVNYISNGKYNGLISHTAGGFSFYQSPRDNRITRWRYNSLPIDRPGRYILLRNKKTGEYWSPTWQPTFTDLEWYECRHGLYYTRISSCYKKIEHSILYFVPDDDLEIWKVVLRNNSKQKINLDIFAFVELCLGHALVDLINQPNDQHFNDVQFDREQEILFASKRYWVRTAGASVAQSNQAWDKYVFFATSLPVKGWDGSKDIFIGRWRSEENPVAVEKGACFNSEITAGDAMAVLQSEIELKPGQQAQFAILLGVVSRDNYKSAAKSLVQKYRNLKTINEAHRKLVKDWHDYTDAVQVKTPDDNMNTMLNVWNQYQTSVTFRFSRDASYYHGGLLFGRGYRDSCQDILGPVITRPEWVRERILEMSRYQFKEGCVFHLYFPLTHGGERTMHTDTPLWLPLAIITYLKETADFEILKQTTGYYDEGEAPILEHLFAAINYTLANLSPRQMAKIGAGDWNDTLDYLGRQGRGESVMVTMFLAYILNETVELCKFLGQKEKAEFYLQKHQIIKNTLNENCWDGAWYIRATNDQGEIIGSAANEEGKIFLNTQSWAVISGVAEGERAVCCMDSVKEHLDTPKGPKILHPAYTKINPNIGLATRCVPGKKENGAVFNHPVSWAILAECILGRGDRAFDIYQRALPMNPVIDIDRYQVEPYVYAEYVTSPDHPTMGQASHSWLTGSSAWMLRDGIDHILGIRPTYEGLMIDPCIPKTWKSYSISRKFRGNRYNIEVRNPNRINRGVRSVTVDGIEIRGHIININDPIVIGLFKNKQEVNVQVLLG